MINFVNSLEDLRFSAQESASWEPTATVGWEEMPFTVVFRSFSEEAIRCYLKAEFPFDCAGSLRWEGQGPALMERTEGSDPAALMELPLIRTTRLLEHAGLPPLIPPSY